MTNKYNTVLYTGITNNLVRRVWEHKQGVAKGFAKKYNVVKLAYYETLEDVNDAIAREKKIKGGSRRKKIELVESMNPGWRDLYYELVE